MKSESTAKKAESEVVIRATVLFLADPALSGIYEGKNREGSPRICGNAASAVRGELEVHMRGLVLPFTMACNVSHASFPRLLVTKSKWNWRPRTAIWRSRSKR